MCLPALAAVPSLFGMSAATAATVGTVASVAGLGLSAMGAYQQSKAAQASADYQAQIARNNAVAQEQQAKDALSRGDDEVARLRRIAGQVKGSQRASMAARGLDLNEGSALKLQEDTDFFGAVDQTTARNNAKREAWGYTNGAANSSANAELYNYNARSQSPGLATATSLLTGAGAVADRWYKYRAA